ncbi:hypothetical protein SUGI_0977060 [Cryptomeria japonica]|nr:hypothetical protein SUGI_0977060 [Cryptomeria japonica]
METQSGEPERDCGKAHRNLLKDSGELERDNGKAHIWCCHYTSHVYHNGGGAHLDTSHEMPEQPKTEVEPTDWISGVR